MSYSRLKVKLFVRHHTSDLPGVSAAHFRGAFLRVAIAAWSPARASFFSSDLAFFRFSGLDLCQGWRMRLVAARGSVGLDSQALGQTEEFTGYIGLGWKVQCLQIGIGLLCGL